jgi:HK97 family phage major capsid protein
MDEKQIKALTDQITTGISELKSEVNGKSAKIDSLEVKYEKILSDIEKLPEMKSYAEKMQGQLDLIEGKLKDIRGNTPEETVQTQLKKIFEGQEVKDVTTALKSGHSVKGLSKEFEVKTGTPIVSSASTQDSGTLAIQQEREPGVTRAPWKMTPIWNSISKGSIGAGRNGISWTERLVTTDATAFVNENTSFGNLSQTWIQKFVTVSKIADFIKVSREDLEDVDYITSEVMDLLGNMIPRKREVQLLSGNGSAPNPQGLIINGTPIAKAFAVPTGVKTNFAVATNYDVLKTAIVQIMIGNSGTDTNVMGFIADLILMHPADIANMHLTKDTLGQYILPPFIAADGMQVDGVPIAPSLDLAAGSFVVGAFRNAKAFIKRDLNIRMWEQNESDPIQDLVTFTATQRLAFRVKTIEAYGFVTGTFNSAIVLLNQAQGAL